MSYTVQTVDKIEELHACIYACHPFEEVIAKFMNHPFTLNLFVSQQLS